MKAEIGHGVYENCNFSVNLKLSFNEVYEKYNVKKQLVSMQPKGRV